MYVQEQVMDIVSAWRLSAAKNYMAIMSPVFFLSGYVVNFLEWKLGYVQQQGLEEEGGGGGEQV